MLARITPVAFTTTLIGLALSVNAKNVKSLNLADISKIVLENGIEKKINAPISLRLGYKSESIPARARKISAKTSSDRTEHTFFVVYDKVKEKRVAREIVIGAVKVTPRNGNNFIEGTAFRAGMDGRLLGSMSSNGFVGEVVISSLAITDPAVRASYNKERSYFENTLAIKSFDP